MSLQPATSLLVLLSVLVFPTLTFTDAVYYTYEEFNTAGVRNSNGPTEWGDIRDSTGAVMYPFCGISSGSQQSPIDLAPQLERTAASLDGSSSLATSHPSLGPLVTENSRADNHLQLGAAQSSFSLSNDGAQMKVIFSVPTDGDQQVASTLPKFVDPFSAGGAVKYILSELSFHHVSDHVVADSRADFEVQMHFTKMASSAQTTTTTSADAVMVVVSVLMDACLSCQNSELAKVWHLLPHWNTTTATTTTSALVTTIDPNQGLSLEIGNLLPPSRDYVCYLGSLTFPPCTRNVRYFVLDGASSSGGGGGFSTLAISYAQIEHFKKAMGWKTLPLKNPQVTLGPVGNYRPIQSDSTTISVMYMYKDLGSSDDVDANWRENVFYDSSKDAGSQLANDANVAAFVGIFLGLFSTVVSLFAIYQTYTRACIPAHSGANPPASAKRNGGGGTKTDNTVVSSGGKKSSGDKYTYGGVPKEKGGEGDSDSGVSAVSAATPEPTDQQIDRRTRVQRFKEEGATPNSKRRGK